MERMRHDESPRHALGSVNDSRRRFRVVSPPALLLAVGLTAVVGWRLYFADDDSPEHWLRVAGDSSYVISIDTTRVGEPYRGIYDVWYRTDHSTTHQYHGTSFNREDVESLLRCNTLEFKVEGVNMSMRGGRIVARQRNDAHDVKRDEWHQVDPRTIEATAAQVTCNEAPRFVGRFGGR